MAKPITGQYECVHSSGVGLDYFTSRIDKITLYANGRFLLTIQRHSRAVNAAQSWVKGQQAANTTPETRSEGGYTHQDTTVFLQFDDGGQEQCRLSPDGTGLQIGPNFFNKVSDSTLLPSTHRMKQDMDDIAKGLKIASTLGGIAMKAAKTIQGTVQSAQGTGNNQPPAQTPPPMTTTPPPARPAQPVQPPPAQQQARPPVQSSQVQAETIFCDQCGARLRPGKRFCNNCGARLA